MGWGVMGLSDTTASLRHALRDPDDVLRAALDRALAKDAAVRLSHPMGEGTGPGHLLGALDGLQAAFPDLERREDIVVSGRDGHGLDWVGMAGHYEGVFRHPLHGIQPSGHAAHLRFHEFWRIENGLIVEVHAIWDLPALMMSVGQWPMAPSLGREIRVPGPHTQDGLGPHPRDGKEAIRVVTEMLAAMGRHPAEPPAAMEMPRFWHPKMMWYGPGGIGTCRGWSGFRHWHQIPFLDAMPDRGSYRDHMTYHFFGEGDYVAVTGWPNMKQTLTGGGWMGLAPTGQTVTLQSLDFWRVEDGVIRENWVMLDILGFYMQVGVDVLARLRAFGKAFPTGPDDGGVA